MDYAYHVESASKISDEHPIALLHLAQVEMQSVKAELDVLGVEFHKIMSAYKDLESRHEEARQAFEDAQNKFAAWIDQTGDDAAAFVRHHTDFVIHRTDDIYDIRVQELRRL